MQTKVFKNCYTQAVKTVMKASVFTGGNKHKKIIPDTQFDSDEQDFALAGNGIENIDTLVIPETQR